MNRKIGNQTVIFENTPHIIEFASIVGPKEGEGPLADTFDVILRDDRFGMETWEAAESKLQRETAILAMNKAKLKTSDIDYILAGDLINQCGATHYGIRDFNIPFFGLFGACSTMTESLALAAILISSGFGNYAIALTSSHFCSAEKQFRYPLEYGGQRPPTAQWTVTGSGCAIVSSKNQGPKITHATIGKIVDLGIKDANNMGAAMAPAAIDTLTAHFKDTGRNPNFYDAIFTGDLGKLGSAILIEKLAEDGFDVSGIHNDCGNLIFDAEKQDVHAGGSGCGCMGSVLCGHILNQVKSGRLKNVLIMATGALLNPTAILQGESIPAIAHAVAISEQ